MLIKALICSLQKKKKNSRRYLTVTTIIFLNQWSLSFCSRSFRQTYCAIKKKFIQPAEIFIFREISRSRTNGQRDAPNREPEITCFRQSDERSREEDPLAPKKFHGEISRRMSRIAGWFRGETMIKERESDRWRGSSGSAEKRTRLRSRDSPYPDNYRDRYVGSVVWRALCISSLASLLPDSTILRAAWVFSSIHDGESLSPFFLLSLFLSFFFFFIPRFTRVEISKGERADSGKWRSVSFLKSKDLNERGEK